MKELKTLVQKAIKAQGEFATCFQGDSNPQTVRHWIQALASEEALKAVLEAIDSPRPTAAFALQTLAKNPTI